LSLKLNRESLGLSRGASEVHPLALRVELRFGEHGAVREVGLLQFGANSVKPLQVRRGGRPRCLRQDCVGRLDPVDDLPSSREFFVSADVVTKLRRQETLDFDCGSVHLTRPDDIELVRDSLRDRSPVGQRLFVGDEDTRTLASLKLSREGVPKEQEQAASQGHSIAGFQ
jgi:hypothetical protein